MNGIYKIKNKKVFLLLTFRKTCLSAFCGAHESFNRVSNSAEVLPTPDRTVPSVGLDVLGTAQWQ